MTNKNCDLLQYNIVQYVSVWRILWAHTAPFGIVPHGCFHIQNGRGFGLAKAISLVQIGSFNLMILTQTKVINQGYCCNRLGYDVVGLPEITTAAVGAQGGGGPGHPGPTPGLEHKTDALPQDKYGEL